MKHLRVKAYISIVFLCLATTFFTFGTVRAQSIDSQTTTGNITNVNGTYDYYQNAVNSYFQAANTAIDEIYNRDKIANAEPTPRYKTYIAAMLAAYTRVFNEEKAKGTPTYDAQIKAVAAFRTAQNEPTNLRLIANYSASAPHRTVISQLSSSMNQAGLAAEQIKRGVIVAGSGDADILMNSSTTITNAAAGNQNQTVKTSDDASKCSFLGESPIIACLDAGVTWLIKNTLLQIGGFLVWLTANMFNYAVQIGVLDFAKWAPESLYPVWKIVRQIVSLIIVFVGLYLGFMYILGKEDKFEKYIPWVIIFALFVNFSYPLTRTLVDISNIISLNIYSSTMGNDVLAPGASVTNTAGALIMDKLGLQELAFSATKTKDGNLLGSVQSVPGALLTVAFVFYTAYIFFMVTAVLVVRTAALVFLTIASPILFVDSVLPVLGTKAQELRKIFFEQLAVAPVFMIMLALTLKFLEVFSAGPVKSTGGLAGLSSSVQGGSTETVVTFFNILMMLIMLHIMIKVTKEVSGSIGKYATEAMGKVGGFGLGVASGGAGLLARKGIGGLASKFGQSAWVQNNKDSFAGRSALSMSNSLSSATFDLRNSSVVGGQMNKLGMGMGMGSKMGYTQERDARIEKRVKMGETVGVYQKNIYDKDGKILHRKGEKDYSPEAEAARKRYRETGGNIFGAVLTDETREVAERLDAADKARFQTKYDKTLSEYKEKAEEANGKFPDTEEGNKAKAEAEKKKSEFFNNQDSETQAKLMKFEAKMDNEREEKEAEKAERKSMASAALEAQKAIADASKSSAEASIAVADELKKMRNPSGSQSTTPQPAMAVLPGSMTTTASGVIIPTSAVPVPGVSTGGNSSTNIPQKPPVVAEKWVPPTKPSFVAGGAAPTSAPATAQYKMPVPPRPTSNVPGVSSTSNSSTKPSSSSPVTI